jgi:hypothetical protein
MPAPTPTATNDKNGKQGTTNQGNERTTNNDNRDTGAVNIDYRGQWETRTARTTDKEAINNEGNKQQGHEPTAGERSWATSCMKRAQMTRDVTWAGNFFLFVSFFLFQPTECHLL